MWRRRLHWTQFTGHHKRGRGSYLGSCVPPPLPQTWRVPCLSARMTHGEDQPRTQCPPDRPPTCMARLVAGADLPAADVDAVPAAALAPAAASAGAAAEAPAPPGPFSAAAGVVAAAAAVIRVPHALRNSRSKMTARSRRDSSGTRASAAQRTLGPAPPPCTEGRDRHDNGRRRGWELWPGGERGTSASARCRPSPLPGGVQS